MHWFRPLTIVSLATSTAARDLFHVADASALSSKAELTSSRPRDVDDGRRAAGADDDPGTAISRRKQQNLRARGATSGESQPRRQGQPQKMKNMQAHRDPAPNPKVLRANGIDSQDQQQKLNEEEEVPPQPGFDFIIAGFPKCGTTSLLKAFAAHDETDMATSEQCAIASPGQADAKVHKLLDGTLATLTSDPSVKRSFKCPTAMFNYKSLSRMETHSPNAKFVVGMRHPVKMLQSFYNYRVTEIREKGLDEPIPTLDEVLAADLPWKGVSMQSTRFDLFLMQMGKTEMTLEQLDELVGQQFELAIKPTNFKVFLYTVEQLEDTTNLERSESFRQEMQHFLGLQNEIAHFGHENKNHAIGTSAHKESISICDDKWTNVRAQLVKQGAKSAQWLRDHFVHSNDVVVANKQHFLESLESWGLDPCVSTAQS